MLSSGATVAAAAGAALGDGLGVHHDGRAVGEGILAKSGSNTASTHDWITRNKRLLRKKCFLQLCNCNLFASVSSYYLGYLSVLLIAGDLVVVIAFQTPESRPQTSVHSGIGFELVPVVL
uniref:Uncharacterized protein n=1 Tax=Anopheles darlingi TaxID=43151 RepID=A0A2M4D2P7_ANODA